MGTPKKAVLLIFAVALAGMFVFGDMVFGKVQPGAEEPEPLFRTDKYSLIIHYMHEIYEHYTVAGKLVKKDDIEYAIVHLRALQYYIDLIPEVIPEKDRDGKPVDKNLYMKNYKELKVFTNRVIKDLKSGNYAKGKPLPPPDVVTKTCDDCHKEHKIPPPW